MDVPGFGKELHRRSRARVRDPGRVDPLEKRDELVDVCLRQGLDGEVLHPCYRGALAIASTTRSMSAFDMVSAVGRFKPRDATRSVTGSSREDPGLLAYGGSRWIGMKN